MFKCKNNEFIHNLKRKLIKIRYKHKFANADPMILFTILKRKSNKIHANRNAQTMILSTKQKQKIR